MNGSSMYQVCKQVQIVLKLFVWIGTSKKKFSTQMFVFDPGGYLNIPTSEDSYDSRMNHLSGGGNDMILKKCYGAAYTYHEDEHDQEYKDQFLRKAQSAF